LSMRLRVGQALNLQPEAELTALFSRKELQPHEHVGLVDVRRDRVVEFGSLQLVRGATLSAALPGLAAILRGQRPDASHPALADDKNGVWVVGPALANGMAVAAFVQHRDAPAASDALGQAAGALVTLGAPVEPFGADSLAAWAVLLVGAIAAGFAAWWSFA